MVLLVPVLVHGHNYHISYLQVFEEIDKVADADTILASSTSCIVPSKFTDGLTHKENCIVAHPVCRKLSVVNC